MFSSSFNKYFTIDDNELNIRFKMGVFLTEILPIKLSAYRQSRLLDINDFYLPERNVYNIIIESMEALLPYPNTILVEPMLYKIGSKRSDIAIKKMTSLNKKRKDNTMDFLLFMEVKTVFADESLTKKDIDDDIDKLLDCYQAYNQAICLFVLIIANSQLEKIKKNKEIKNFLESQDNQDNEYRGKVKLTSTNDDESQKEFDFTIYIFSISSDGSERDIVFTIKEE